MTGEPSDATLGHLRAWNCPSLVVANVYLLFTAPWCPDAFQRLAADPERIRGYQSASADPTIERQRFYHVADTLVRRLLPVALRREGLDELAAAVAQVAEINGWPDVTVVRGRILALLNRVVHTPEMHEYERMLSAATDRGTVWVERGLFRLARTLVTEDIVCLVPYLLSMPAPSGEGWGELLKLLDRVVENYPRHYAQLSARERSLLR